MKRPMGVFHLECVDCSLVLVSTSSSWPQGTIGDHSGELLDGLIEHIGHQLKNQLADNSPFTGTVKEQID